jgi:putative component of toxin-antitoxin plasmid stabilization module
MPVALKSEYKSFLSCLYFLEKNQVGDKSLRFKIYNKWLHFLQSEQAKKKVSMNLKTLLLGSNAYYQKHLKAMK